MSTVTGVSPSSGPVAGGTSVIITRNSLSAVDAVNFGANPAASFSVNVNVPTQINAVSPPGSAGTVDITFHDTSGWSSTSPADWFIYIPPAPTISGINPTSGPTAGGTSVVITGTNLTGARSVYFGGSLAASYTVNSSTQITAVSPAEAAGEIEITVATLGGSAQYPYTFVVPIISGISPNSGTTAGGTSVVITGTNLTGASAVKFGGSNAASYTVNSSTQITAVSPAKSAGTVDITVTTPNGTSATTPADQFTFSSGGASFAAVIG